MRDSFREQIGRSIGQDRNVFPGFLGVLPGARSEDGAERVVKIRSGVVESYSDFGTAQVNE